MKKLRMGKLDNEYGSGQDILFLDTTANDTYVTKTALVLKPAAHIH